MIRVCVPDDRKRIFRDRRPLRLAALDSVWSRATGSNHPFRENSLQGDPFADMYLKCESLRHL